MSWLLETAGNQWHTKMIQKAKQNKTKQKNYSNLQQSNSKIFPDLPLKAMVYISSIVHFTFVDDQTKWIISL
jgi:hypothetical protein